MSVGEREWPGMFKVCDPKSDSKMSEKKKITDGKNTYKVLGEPTTK